MNKRIIIDARMYGESGIGRYIRNLVNKLQEIDKDNEYFILLLEKDYHLLEYKENFHKISADFHWYGANEQIRLPKLLKNLNPDLVHFPHFNVPILYKGKFVVTIHDLIHQHFQMRRATTLNPLFYQLKQYGYKKIFKSAVKKSKKILAPSNYVKDLLVNEWKVSKDKVNVTYEAVDTEIMKKCQTTTREKNKTGPYLFYVGNAHPHKNIEGLIKAFLTIKENYPDLKLVLAGHDHYFWQRIKKEFQQEGIIYTGYISDEELVDFYKNAKAFIMPSLEEGFGIPILEAMACSCPVVSSSAGSLPEIGGEAAVYFNPTNLDDMVNKISQVLNDEKLGKKLIEKGFKRYQEFSWQKLAQETLEVYRQCA